MVKQALIWENHAACMQDLQALATSLLERALLLRQLAALTPASAQQATAGAASSAGDDKLASLYRQASHAASMAAASDPQQQRTQLEQPLAQLQAALAQQWQHIGQCAAATRQASIFIPWLHVTGLFRLSEQEQAMLLLALLNETAPPYADILRALAGQAGEDNGSEGAWLPVYLMTAILADTAGGRISLQQSLLDDAPLRQFNLLAWREDNTPPGTLDDQAGGPVNGGLLRIETEIAAFLQNLAVPPLRLLQPLRLLPASLPLERHWVVEDIRLQLTRFIAQCSDPANPHSSFVLQLQCPDHTLARSLCAASFAGLQLGCALLDGYEIARLVRQHGREALQPHLRRLARDA